MPVQHLPDRAVATLRAAREVGRWPAVSDIPVQLDHILPGAGTAPWRRRVPRGELERLRAAPGFPSTLLDRTRLVDGAAGARLLGVGTARFARLARGGCFSPVRFHLNRYRAVVWRYPAEELRLFAERWPELLRGPAPEGLRRVLRRTSTAGWLALFSGSADTLRRYPLWGAEVPPPDWFANNRPLPARFI
jgi:hypothetical protein